MQALRGVISAHPTRMAVSMLVSAGALLLLDPIVAGYAVGGFVPALAAVVLGGLINALLWPLAIRVALPVTVLTLGLGALVLNGAVVVLIGAVLPEVTVAGLGTGIALTLMLTVLTGLVAALLSIDDDDRFAAHVARLARRRPAAPGERSEVPGVLFCEIDGLSREVLERALRDGHAPALAAWLREGTHRLAGWETDWSSQTGACQAGILHGRNDDLPAFRWWEKDRGDAIVTNHPRDAAEIERRVSDGRGLLHAGGASRANILSGDATHSLLTMSTVLDTGRGRIGRDYFTYFSSPYNVARTLLRALADIAGELWAAAQQRRRDVRPRVHRGLRYSALRAWATVVQLDLQVEAVLGDIRAGRPIVYTTFLAYDEVAHHSGVERPDTMKVLRDVDRQVARIALATDHAPRPYEIVVLSDHGQTQGATFRQRYGRTLEAFVREWCETADVRAEASGEDEARGRLAAALTEASAGDTRGARTVRRATERRRVGGEVRLDDAAGGRPEPAEVPPPAPSGDLPEIAVFASGCLGLISFPRVPGRLSRDAIDARWPALLPGLRAHPGIGFVLVDGTVLGAAGERRLADGGVDGEDPLAPYGPNAARHVARTDGFATCPDIVVNSTWFPATGEVAAFEELVGSHGGLGGGQSFPFLMAPAALPLPAEPIVGAEAVHEVLRGWLALLGHEGYAR